MLVKMSCHGCNCVVPGRRCSKGRNRKKKKTEASGDGGRSVVKLACFLVRVDSTYCLGPASSSCPFWDLLEILSLRILDPWLTGPVDKEPVAIDG